MRLSKIQKHLTKSPFNKVTIGDDIYFRNTYNYKSHDQESIKEQEQEAGKDIQFYYKGVLLRRFDNEGIEDRSFNFTDHANSTDKLLNAIAAFSVLEAILGSTDISIKLEEG